MPGNARPYPTGLRSRKALGLRELRSQPEFFQMTMSHRAHQAHRRRARRRAYLHTAFFSACLLPPLTTNYFHSHYTTTWYIKKAPVGAGAIETELISTAY